MPDLTHLLQAKIEMCGKASEGPWFVFGNGHCVGAAHATAGEGTGGVAMCGMRLRSPTEIEANAAFIASARTDLPACLKALIAAARVVAIVSDPHYGIPGGESNDTTYEAALDEYDTAVKSLLNGAK